jgi:hypothetical protein
MTALVNPVIPVNKALWQQKKSDLFLVLPFLVLFFVQLSHHQLWRDELNAWGIAVASPDIKTLFKYIHYEGHPSLWYLLLWFASRWTSSPVAMKCIEAVIGASIYLFIAIRSPFSQLEKVLLFCSYFISFEYTVFSRMYGLYLLLSLIYANRRAVCPNQMVRNAVILGLLANTDMMGIILSLPLLVEYGLDRIERWRESGSPSATQILRAGLVYLVLLAFALWSLKLAPDISWRTTGRIFQYAYNLIHLLHSAIFYIVVPWWPLGKNTPINYWNPLEPAPKLLWLIPIALGVYYLLFRRDHNVLLLVAVALGFAFGFVQLIHINSPRYGGITLLVPVILGAYYLSFRHDRNLLLLVFLTVTIAVAFGHFIYMGSTRHGGVTLLAVLIALWIQRYRRPSIPFLVYALLGISAASGATAAVAQWYHPFSNAGAAAQWLRDHHLQNAVLVGTPDTSVAGVAEELERPMYFLDCSCSDSFLLFSNRRDDFDWDQIPQRLALAAQQLHAPEMILIVSHAGLSDEDKKAISKQSLQVTPIAKFAGAEVWGEDFYLYRVNDLHANKTSAEK